MIKKNKIVKYVGIFLCLIMMFKVSADMFHAYDKYYEIYKKYESSLNAQKQGQLENWVAAMQFGMYEEYYESWICSGALGDGTVIEILLNEGYYTEYYDEIKAAGLIRADYVLPSSKRQETTPTVTPEPVTTEKCEEKDMWSKSDVNVRENGSTSYKKVSSLKKDEKVTVTGIDSTGWYEIRKEDGTVGHVSDKYLTEEAPSVSADVKEDEKVPEANPVKESYIINIDGRTVTWYNAELGMEEIAVLDDKIPLDKVEEMANQYLIHGESYSPTPVAEPTKKPTPAPTIAPSKKPESTPTVSPTDVSPEENTAESTGNFIEKLTDNPIYIFSCIAVGIGLIVYGIYHTRKNRKK